MFEGLMRAPLRPNCAQSLAMLWRSQKSSAGLRKPIYADSCATILGVAYVPPAVSADNLHLPSETM